MSYHSRTSSEAEIAPLKKILRVAYPLFESDFDLFDIKDQLHDIFTKDEVDDIIHKKIDDRKKTIRLFSILAEKSDEAVKHFVEALKVDYPFIRNKILSEYDRPSGKTVNYLQEIDRLLNSDQRFAEYNVLRLEPYAKLQEELKRVAPLKNVVLLGNLGAGKKWLARDVLCDYSVQKAMGFRIYWLNVKNCTNPENDFRMLQQLRQTMSYRSASNGVSYGGVITGDIVDRIFHLQQEIKHMFSQSENRKSLLVLSDVQNIKTLNTFNLDCKILVLTRFSKVSEHLSSKTTKHLVLSDKLTCDEAKHLFEKYLHCNREVFPKQEFDRIIQQTKNPLKLSFIASHLRGTKSDWKKWTDIDYTKLTAIVECSLNVLSSEYLKHFAALSIFPEDASIPTDLLQKIWNKPCSVTEDILKKFSQFSFINVEDETITLSNIYSAQLQHSEKIQNLIDAPALHKKVIEYFSIDDAFNQSNESDLSKLPNYFYNYIAHHLVHLKEEDERFKLFRKIFLSFEFLEQKIRVDNCSILNTLILLNFYKKQKYCDERDRGLICEICQFLPKIEEKLHAEDTRLLQYAFMEESGEVYEEAKRQMLQYPNQVWFEEKGDFHQRRHVLNLHDQTARAAQYLHPETCLVVLENNSIQLRNISLEGNKGTILLNQGEMNRRIVHHQTFNNHSHLLALDQLGEIRVWSIDGDVNNGSGCSLVHRKSSKQKVHNHSFQEFSMQNKRQHIIKSQWSYTSNDHLSVGRIVAFHVCEIHSPHYIRLIIAHKNGDLHWFEWLSDQNQKIFKKMHVYPTKTKKTNIRFLCKVLMKYCLLITNTGEISIWNVNDTSNVYEYKAEAEIVHMTHFIQKTNTVVLFIFSQKVLKMTLEHKTFHDKLDALTEIIYEHPESEGCITCAKLSPDNRYLLLGTQQGLLVWDMTTKLPLLRSNVSEHITCVDIECINDNSDPLDPKYIVLCGALNRNVLNIHAIRQSGDRIIWVHQVESGIDETARLEPDVRLRGRKLFDVTFDEKQGDTHVMAVDSKNRVHQICTDKKNDKNWFTITPEAAFPITSVTTFGATMLVANEKGNIFNVNDESYLAQDIMNTPITYLQLLDANRFVASSRKQSRTLISSLNDDETGLKTSIEFFTRQAYICYERFLLLLGDDTVLYIDLLQPEEQWIAIKDQSLMGYELKNSLLFLATRSNTLLIYDLNVINNRLDLTLIAKREQLVTQYEDTHVTCLTSSNDASLIALGLSNGAIEVYNFDREKISIIYELKSHKEAICELKFSPCNEVLVSCAEQFCFWKVQYLVNNPFEDFNNGRRRSSRFFSKNCCKNEVGTEEVDALPVLSYGTSRNENLFISTMRQNLQEANDVVEQSISPWLNKQAAAKSEILACIKFDGNRAEKFFANRDFTQFITIDNEGVYYHLKLLQMETFETDIVTDYMRDYSADEIIDEVNDLIIHENIDFEMQRNSIEYTGVDVAGNSPMSSIENDRESI